MTRALLPLLLLAAACATPTTEEAAPTPPPEAATPTPPGEPIDESAFSATQWMADVRAAETDAERIALSERLLDAVDWRTACGEDDPTNPGRGLVQLHEAGTHTLAEVTCQRAAYQSVFALVDAAAGRPPRLVRSFTVTDDGEPTQNETVSFFGLVSTDAPGTFAVLTKSAGHGGCGTDVRYRLLADGGAEIAEVRAHPDCADPLPPDDWPVTYRVTP